MEYNENDVNIYSDITVDVYLFPFKTLISVMPACIFHILVKFYEFEKHCDVSYHNDKNFCFVKTMSFFCVQ